MSLPSSLVLLSALLLPLSAQQYSLQPFTIDGLPTYAAAINNRGAIVGYCQPQNAGRRAFKRHASGATEFVTIPDIYDTVGLSGINNFGDMVGSASFSARGLRVTWGFKLTGGPQGTYTRISYSSDSDPFYTVSVNGLNSVEDFVGSSSSFGGFATIGRVFSVIQFPGSSLTVPNSIAWDRTIVGCHSPPLARLRAFLRGPHENFLELKIENAQSACAYGINNANGKIVGSFQDAAGKWHGFTYDYLNDLASARASVQTITIPVQIVDYPGATRTTVTGINGQGVIVGWADLPNGPTTSFIGTPKPLP